jgi:hypothetical protein
MGSPGESDASIDASAADSAVLMDATIVDASSVDAASPRLDASANDAAQPTCPVSASGVIAVSKPALELGRLAKSSLFRVRVLGPLVRWGTSDHVWTFNNAYRADAQSAPAATPSNHPFIAFDGPVQPWNQKVTAPWTLKVSTLDSQLPPTALPLAMNEPNTTALVPTSLVRVGEEPRSQMFVLQYDNIGGASKVWLATVADGAVQAQRAALPLFSEPPWFAVAARYDGDYLTVYACDKDCVAARVRSDKFTDPSAYQVRSRNAKGQWVWSDDLKSGTPVLTGVSGTDLTISYNSYLRRFLAVYAKPAENDAWLATSEAPYGPWSEPIKVALPAPAALWNFGIREQAPLAQNCERRVVITYFAPSSATGLLTTDGETVMAAIDLD